MKLKSKTEEDGPQKEMIPEVCTIEEFMKRITEMFQDQIRVDSGLGYRLLIYSKYQEKKEKKLNLLQYLLAVLNNVFNEFLKTDDKDLWQNEGALLDAMIKESNLSDFDKKLIMLMNFGWKSPYTISSDIMFNML